MKSFPATGPLHLLFLLPGILVLQMAPWRAPACPTDAGSNAVLFKKNKTKNTSLII